MTHSQIHTIYPKDLYKNKSIWLFKKKDRLTNTLRTLVNKEKKIYLANCSSEGVRYGPRRNQVFVNCLGQNCRQEKGLK